MSFQLQPVGCCRCSCDPSVTINIVGGGGAEYSGTEDPNVTGFLPADTTVISTFNLLTDTGYYAGQSWKWNVQHQFWG